MKTWNVFLTFESVDETLSGQTIWLKTFTCLLHSFSERSEIWRRKKIIITFSAPKTATSDELQFHPNSNITKSRKKAYKNYCCDQQISMRNNLIFIQVPSPFSLRKYEEPISLENFYEDVLDLKRFSVRFYYFVKNSENINLFKLSQKKTRKYSGSVFWIHDFIYELNLATAHFVDGHEIGRGLQFLRLAC